MWDYILMSGLLVLVCANPPNRPIVIPRLDGRIVGGEPVRIEDYPHQVSLQYFGSHICGGSLISARFVVTAAHCTDGISSASPFSIRVGTTYHNSGGTVVSVSAVHQHPSFNSWTLDYDLSVLYLSADVNAGSVIDFIELPEQDFSINEGEELVVTGWGALAEGGALASQLQAVTVLVISQEDCRDAYDASLITDRMMCAGLLEDGGKDACQGDSGGPLVSNGILVGIVSWGHGCARPIYPGVYSSVPALITYVSEIIDI